LPYVGIEKHRLNITKICERARSLLAKIDSQTLDFGNIITMVREMRQLDQAACSWRDSPNWDFKTVHRTELSKDPEVLARLPHFVQLHCDAWIAYEWNYHRTARILMHGQLLRCLDRVSLSDDEMLQAEAHHLRQESVIITQNLADEILSTVPQSFGDLDQDGKFRTNSSYGSRGSGVGGYFLLWPIRIIKSLDTATQEQRETAKEVFERIRELTGMRSILGDVSSI
jgi:hypothetical protein